MLTFVDILYFFKQITCIYIFDLSIFFVIHVKNRIVQTNLIHSLETIRIIVSRKGTMGNPLWSSGIRDDKFAQEELTFKARFRS